MNFGSYLTRGNSLPKANGFTSTGVFNTGSTINDNSSSPIKRVMAYVLGIVIIIFIILLFVHWFIRPIFKLHPGGSGIIPVPGGDDGVLFWKNGNTGQIMNSALPIQSISAGYSMIMDMFIVNPLQFSKHPRILFSRGATVKAVPSGDLLLGVLDNYNLAVALLPDTNDMIVSVLNKDNNMENVIVSNAPVQEAFRLGIVVMDQALEVYMNGHLLKTRAFDSPPKAVTGDIYPASGIEANIAKIRNLKIWSRILPTPEIRESTPAPATGKDFDAGAMPSSTSCAPQEVDSMIDRINTAMA
uniref:Uncharacterized protein n=1 Tax=viral metagenome TaxID=1070528 RepID=A0A6C0KVJ7_9ZZZZ